jgi:hypothetical protein
MLVAVGGGMKDQDEHRSLVMVMRNNGQSDNEKEKLSTRPQRDHQKEAAIRTTLKIKSSDLFQIPICDMGTV